MMIKNFLRLLTISMILSFYSCNKYKYPYSEEKNIPIDEKLIGCWEAFFPIQKNYSAEKPFISVERLNDFEIVITFPPHGDLLNIKMRAHLVNINGTKVLQITHIKAKKNHAKYFYVKYKIIDDTCTLYKVNDNLVYDSYRPENEKPSAISQEKWEQHIEKYKGLPPADKAFRDLFFKYSHDKNLFIEVDDIYFKKTSKKAMNEYIKKYQNNLSDFN